MPTIIKIKEHQADKLYECAEKVHRGAKKLMEFFNSFAHEVDHIEKHIAKTLNFSPYSESASYLVGEIIRNMFYNITRKMLC